MTPRDERWMLRLDAAGPDPGPLDAETLAQVAFFEGLRAELRAAVQGDADVDGILAAVELNAALAGEADVDGILAAVELNAALAGEADVDGILATVELNAALAGEADVDGILAAVELNAATAGGLDLDALMASVELNAATAGGLDLDALMASVELNAATAGRADVDGILAAVELNAATAGAIDAVAVLRTVELEARRPMPRWVSLGALPMGMFAAAAAVVLAIFPPSFERPVELPVAVVEPSFQLSAFNQVEVEDASTDADASLQILQFEEGGPTVILVDDPRGH